MERQSSSESPSAPQKARKKRIPKACGSCRRSKVRCDGQRPCSRCSNLKKVCVFTEPPKDEQEKKIEALESQIEALKAQLGGSSPATTANLTHHPLPVPSILTSPMDENVTMQDIPPLPQSHHNTSAIDFTPSTNLIHGPTASPITTATFHPPPAQPPQHISLEHVDTSPSTTAYPTGGSTSSGTKRKRSHFTVEPVLTDFDADVVRIGLITPVDAEAYFAAFFRGCHQYVPVFDPRYDDMNTIRARSGLLFSTICAVGCRVLKGTESQPWRMLNFHIKRALNAAIARTRGAGASLETVQALLVRACFVSERSLLVTVATRMAVDLRLYEAYDELSTRYITRTSLGGSEMPVVGQEDDDSLMRKVRTWVHLLVLGHILHVDAGDLLTFRFSGNVRRCRILLEGPTCTDLDLHLFSQVELNVLRANTYTALEACSNNEDSADIMDVVHDAKIDIDVWFNDWMRIFERRAPDASARLWLNLHLRVQQCWADTMALCRAVRISGVENVDAMTSQQRSMLLMAKTALRQHLDIILEKPREYLRNLRFAMDFVWAKCAFCFLLLLKLSMLVAEDDEATSRTLIAQGKTLLSELHASSNGGGGGGRGSSTSRVYLQLLQTGIEKFSRTVLGENLASSSNSSNTSQLSGRNTPRNQRDTARGENSSGAEGAAGDEEHNELESFVPEQFVFEWDFPGLTLFSNPTTEVGWLDDFLRGALVGGEDFYGFTWNPVDPS